jgi:L-serine dehydratase
MKPIDLVVLSRAISVHEVFCIGIGPSSSHTVGPMRAARLLTRSLCETLETVDAVTVELFGSLSLAEKGHRTDDAVLLGLAG